MQSGIKILVTVVLLLMAVSAAGYYSHNLQHKNPAGSKNLIRWRTDLASARQEAIAAKKPLFIEFSATWCPDCQNMKTQTWTQPVAADALQKYIPVAIDTDDHPDLRDKYQVTSIPSFFIVDPATDKIGRENRDGFLPADQMVAWLK